MPSPLSISCEEPSLLPPLPDDFESLLESLATIGSPTGREKDRAHFIVDWFGKIQPGSAERDEIDNVMVDLGGGDGEAWLFDAHTDIVFEDAAPQITKNQNTWRCPGILDDTVCCVLLMLLGRALLATGRTWPIVISFSVCEEGRGNLRGILALGRKLKHRLRGAWALDGNLDRATAKAAGSKRWKVAWSGPGGHSWSDFGTPSPIHAMGAWISAMESAAPWKPSHLTYNIGKISGGSTVTTIANEAECLLDLRSVCPKALAAASDAALHLADGIAKSRGLEMRAEQTGGRPAATVPADPPMLEWLEAIHFELGLPFQTIVNSTNANGLLSLGIPASCTGLARGGNIHSRDEWLDVRSAALGWRKLWMLFQRSNQEISHVHG